MSILNNHTPRAKSISALPLPSHHTCYKSTSSTHDSPCSFIASPPRDRCLSYFPPFESMGSVDDESIAGPSRCIPARKRGKGSSLGSPAGLMSWMTLTSSTSSPDIASSDVEAVQALSKRCSVGKRRVLKPLMPANGDLENERVKMVKRRVEPKVDSQEVVVRIIGKANRVIGKDDEVFEQSATREVRRHTTSLLRLTSISQLLHRWSRPNLAVPLLSVPYGRYPLPSPPVTSNSARCPHLCFQNPSREPHHLTRR